MITAVPVSAFYAKEYKFVPELDSRIFAHVNERLLKPRFCNQNRVSGKVNYSHPITIDKFYSNPIDHSSSAQDVRVSIDKKSSSVKECLIKLKPTAVLPGVNKELADRIDFYCGSEGALGTDNGALDFRISAKIEQPFNYHKIKADPQSIHLIRLKDRMSYDFDGLLSVDLTRVETWKDSSQLKECFMIDAKIPSVSGRVTYEIEIEILNYDLIRREAQKQLSGQVNNIPQLAQWYLENVETLAKYALPNIAVPPACQQSVHKRSSIDAHTESNDQSSESKKQKT